MTRLAVASIAFLVIFTVFTTVYAAAANKAEVRLLPKWVWVLLCLLVPFFGGLLYLMVGRPLGRGPAGGTGRTRTIAPDDDPNFLRDLGRKLRNKDEDNK
jgi:protein-S-isoprenylcysteine O-methyltransferase Ste14